jgi:hypothetical protein
MLRHNHLEHRFVHYIPEQLEPGIIYISMDFATAAHSCCCGCGEQVITPFTPTDWKMTFDGETVTLSPSIGNWNSACQSHYFIVGNRVVEAEPWIDKKGARKRKFGKEKWQNHLDQKIQSEGDPSAQPAPSISRRLALWTEINRRLKRRP